MSEQLDRIERKLDSALSQMGAVVLEKPKAELYDEHGISYEVSKYHGVRLKAVEDLYKTWINKGGQHKQVAETMNHWFCFVRPDKPLKENIFNMISANQQRSWALGWLGAESPIVADYNIIRGKYKHKVTGAYAFKRPSYFDADYKNWVSVNFAIDGLIDNHYTASFGNYSSPNNPEFYSQFVERIVDSVERIMNGKIAILNDPARRTFPI